MLLNSFFKEIEPLAICLLCVIGIVFLSVNMWLFSLVRRKDEPGALEILRSAGQILRQPWKREDDGWQELSNRVKNLKK
ncbi:MAG TPA: hypothetical protein PKW33_14140 [Anaerolineaceae bacterium]|nr:hypothetical protein [Anaerolineaceae bacterium]HPN52728.1 hypothetical protein [Anaerolineaceae bacterium]